MMAGKSTNRWIILIASILANLCIGSAYAWSVFQKPLIAMFGWSTAQASLAFTINLGLVPLAMIVAGKIQDKQGPKMVSLLGGIVFSVGIFATGFVKSLTMLYITYGVLGGIGIGMVYACTIANTTKWFPDKRGLAGGLAAAGFGSGSVVLAPVAATLIGRYGVLDTFRILGVVFLVVATVCTLTLKAPEPGWKPEGWTPPQPAAAGKNSSLGDDMGPGEMIRTPKFYILWAMYAIGCISGLMIIGHASSIGQEKIGLTPQVAAVAVGIIGLFNTFGRIFWGWVSDKVGRYTSIVGMYIVSGAALMVLKSAGDYGIFMVGACGVGLAFGGFMGIFPSVTADGFGAKNMGTNYGVMFTAFGIGAIIGPRIAALVKQSSGLYDKAFVIASVLDIVGILCTLMIIKWSKAEKSVSA